MTDLQDVVLDKESEPMRPAPSGRRLALWAVVTLALVAAAALAWYGYRRSPSPAEVTKPAAVAAEPSPAAPPAPLGIETPTVDVPPLDQSDAFVRDLVRDLSAHPAVIAWLMTPGLIRNFAVVVDNIATGATPARHLRVLAPRGPFPAVERGGRLVADPAGYRRYDAIAAAIGGIDASGAARLYSTLKPRIEEAYRALGRDESFDLALEAAIVSMLQVPVTDEAALVPRGALYPFADTRLEGLTAAQKQLMRMGPEHVRMMQLELRQIASALGIPPGRLPAAR